VKFNMNGWVRRKQGVENKDTYKQCWKPFVFLGGLPPNQSCNVTTWCRDVSPVKVELNEELL